MNPARFNQIRRIHDEHGRLPRWQQEHADAAHDHRGELIEFCKELLKEKQAREKGNGDR